MSDADPYEGTLVSEAMRQYNARLVAIVEGKGPEGAMLLHEEGGPLLPDGSSAFGAYVKGDVVPLLTLGLDIHRDAFEQATHALAHDLVAELVEGAQATGQIPCSTVQNALQAMWIAGCLHERERARREATGEAPA